MADLCFGGKVAGESGEQRAAVEAPRENPTHAVGRRQEEQVLSNVHPYLRRLPLIAIAAILAVFLASPGIAGAKSDNSNGRGKVVDVMTRNLYLGADLTPAILATNPTDLATANGQI